MSDSLIIILGEIFDQILYFMSVLFLTLRLQLSCSCAHYMLLPAFDIYGT